MNEITIETRRESHQKTEKPKRYDEILTVLTAGKELTAREIAYALRYSDLNAVKPRLTELCRKGTVEAVGKKYDPLTQRNVAVYRRITC